MPIWCVGAIDRPKSMARALRWDGLLPQVLSNGKGEPPTLEQIAAVREQVGDRPYDIVIEGEGSQHSPAAWAEAGATWWIESMWDAVGQADPVLAALDRLQRRPPRCRSKTAR